MSANTGVQHDAASLVRHADHYDTCEDFRGDVGDVLCAGCGQHFTDHVVVALRGRAAQSCGTCAHSSDESTWRPSATSYCTNPAGYFAGKLVPNTARCDKWVQGPACRECRDTGKLEVTLSSDPAGSVDMFCDRCDLGTNMARDREAMLGALEDEALGL